jgi:hypothetical protein
MSTNETNVQRILGEVHARVGSPGPPIMLDLETFRSVYRAMIERQLIDDHQVFGILLDKMAVLWFPKIAGLEFNLQNDKAFTERDFDFALRARLVGTTKGKYGFANFVVDELKAWRTRIAVCLAAAFPLLLYVGSDRSAWDDVIQATLPAVALFTSLFVLFTAAQRQGQQGTSQLLKSSVYHRYNEVDRYVAFILGSGLLMCLLSLSATTVTRHGLKGIVGTPAFILGSFFMGMFAVTWAVLALVGFYYSRSAAIERSLAVPELKEQMQAEYDRANQV